MPVPQFIFVRHGEAEHNVAFHQVGEQAFLDPKYEDAPLTETGKKQVRETGRALGSTDLRILSIWSSPLVRCIQTGEEIFEHVNAQQLYLHDNLIECQGGGHICNRRNVKPDLKQKYPIWNTDFLADIPSHHVSRETLAATAARMKMMVLFLAFVYENAPEGSHILIVSHETAIASFTGKSLKNAEYIVLDFHECLRSSLTSSFHCGVYT